MTDETKVVDAPKSDARTLHFKLAREFAETDKGKLLSEAMRLVVSELGLDDGGDVALKCPTCELTSPYIIQLAAAKAMEAYALPLRQKLEQAQSVLGKFKRMAFLPATTTDAELVEHYTHVFNSYVEAAEKAESALRQQLQVIDPKDFHNGKWHIVGCVHCPSTVAVSIGQQVNFCSGCGNKYEAALEEK